MNTSTTCSNLLHFNTNCLIEILSQDCLTDLDLCSLAETCRVLKAVANEVFKIKYKIHDFHHSLIYPRNRTSRILTNFGSSISGIHFLWFKLRKDYEIDQMFKYCTNLKRLLLIESDFDVNISVKFKSLFENLDSISCIKSNVCDAQNLFSYCKSLVDLSVADDPNCHGSVQSLKVILTNSFPKLERFVCHTRGLGQADIPDIQNFILRHTNLKKLKILNFDIASLLPTIFGNLKNLEELSINSKSEFETVVNSLPSLAHLKVLKMNCNEKNVTKFIQRMHSLKSLKHLKLVDVVCDRDLILAISRLAHLNVLFLDFIAGQGRDVNLSRLGNLHQLTELKIFYFDKYFRFDVLDIIKRLIHLKKLVCLVDNFEMYDEMYFKIVDIVSYRRRWYPKYTLSITSYSHMSCYKIAQSTHARNGLKLLNLLDDDDSD